MISCLTHITSDTIQHKKHGRLPTGMLNKLTVLPYFQLLKVFYKSIANHKNLVGFVTGTQRLCAVIFN